MKKIIATVLAMVMALALCTTAFAATKTEEVDKEGYTLMDMANKDLGIKANFTKTVTDTKVETSGSKTTTTYYADEYKIDEQTYYACDAAIAEYKLVKGSTVVYLEKSVSLAAGTTKVATAYVEAKDEPACGEIKENSYTIDGVNYVAGGANLAVLNGKFVTYGEKTATAPHDFGKKNTTTDNKGKIVSITCDSCKKSFSVVAEGKVPTNYTGEVDNTTLADSKMVILLGTVSNNTNTNTNTTTSPKTFDAGIAMYVGMALTSVAGSAVVIGKKKEF